MSGVVVIKRIIKNTEEKRDNAFYVLFYTLEPHLDIGIADDLEYKRIEMLINTQDLNNFAPISRYLSTYNAHFNKIN